MNNAATLSFASVLYLITEKSDIIARNFPICNIMTITM